MKCDIKYCEITIFIHFMQSDEEPEQINQEVLNQIFQNFAQLTHSVISINDRLDRLESTTIRLQDRLSKVQRKYNLKLYAMKDPQFENDENE